MTQLASVNISFIGGGNMAKALLGGLSHHAKQSHIHVVDVKEDNLVQLKEQFGVTTSQQIDARIGQTDVVILSVKPQQIYEVTQQLTPHLTPHLNKPLIISIAAGIRALDLSRWLHDYPAVVRAMPNTPALIQQGITGMYAAPQVNAEQRAIADTILCAVGKTVWLENEELLDSLTAISGSGPAYVFYFIEALQKAAQELGLNQTQARELALATFLGAAQLAAQSDEPVTVLRERVTSKGGTTQAAIQCMEQNGVATAIVAAAKAAAERSRELGAEYGKIS